ncbi:hypothetical protein NDU88_002253 [Pleurodeles waltl]|uniref:Uncharacterized protein n=1 Tax=Pleurodeles waltl TaxID=8319 RepID=A0AAV7TKK6_PLEWA|nr:hypothetical protein NDU88_002253 [Pleurodeles waltl]
MVQWVASKPSLRVIIKGYVRRREALPSQSITGLESGIADLEHLVQWSDWEPGRQLALLSMELRQVSLVEARQCWQASTQKVYELADKTGKVLYWLATGVVLAWVIPLTRDQVGSVWEEQPAIACTFASYYKDIYAQVLQPPEEQDNPILGDIPLPLFLPLWLKSWIPGLGSGSGPLAWPAAGSTGP